MSDRRWFQVHWSAERTDNISAIHLKDAYTQAWHIGDRDLEAGIGLDSAWVVIEDMVSGRTYRVPVEYLEADLADGWREFARGIKLVEPRLDHFLAAERVS